MKTLPEIRAEIAARNAEVNGVAPGQPGYDAELDAWASERFEDEKRKEKVRLRGLMRTDFMGLPPWLRGPFYPAFVGANAALDNEDPEAAHELVNLVDPPTQFNGTQLAAFQTAKAQFLAQLTSYQAV